jgi:hypothetical protein
MAGRLRRARIVLLAAAATYACSASGGGDDGGGAPQGSEAAVQAVDGASHPSKSCEGLPDGTLCGPAPDVCHDLPVCSAGVCAPAVAKADGFHWNASDDAARCCGGVPVETTSDTNCGACGIECNAADGESCQALGGHYFCRGCMASDACWSHCCSLSFAPPSCAASDCRGNCSTQYCPAGTHCVSGSGASSDYCTY